MESAERRNVPQEDRTHAGMEAVTVDLLNEMETKTVREVAGGWEGSGFKKSVETPVHFRKAEWKQGHALRNLGRRVDSRGSGMVW